MEQKKVIIEALKDLVIEFEESSKIENYAIIFDERIVLGPNAISLTKGNVEEILKILNFDKYEEKIQKGVLNLVLFEFEEELIFYLRCMPKVRIISNIKKERAENARILLVDFAEKVRKTVEPLYKSSEVKEDAIDQMLNSLEKMVDEFEIPKFEEFKKLVKYTIPVKKKQF